MGMAHGHTVSQHRPPTRLRPATRAQRIGQQLSHPRSPRARKCSSRLVRPAAATATPAETPSPTPSRSIYPPSCAALCCCPLATPRAAAPGPVPPRHRRAGPAPGRPRRPQAPPRRTRRPRGEPGTPRGGQTQTRRCRRRAWPSCWSSTPPPRRQRRW